MLNAVFTIDIFQLLLLSVFLLTSRKGKKISNRILAFFFLLLALNLSNGLLVYYGFYAQYPSLAHWEDGFILLVGPVLLFYTRSIVYRDWQWTNTMLLHFLPFALLTAAFQVFYHTQPASYQKMVQHAVMNRNLPPTFYFTIVLIYMQVGVYLVLSFLEIKRYRSTVRERLSSISQINLDWLSFMLIFFSLIVGLSFFQVLLPLTGGHYWFNLGVLILGVFFFVFITGIVWKGLQHPALFLGIEQPVATEKYAGSGLTSEEKSTAISLIDQLVVTEKFFLNPDITVDQLADKLAISPRKLSQVINEHYRQNFFDFINSLRIEEAKRIFQTSPDTKLTVLEVMYQSGFNSKSSFNTLFRKKTGQTPSAFRKACLMSSTL